MGIGIIVDALVQFLNIYLALLLIRVLLSWFPTIDWSSGLFSVLSQITDPYLNLFRSIIPPLGGIDISPMLAFFALQIVVRLLSVAAVQAAVYSGGL
jgi:YggT family protein